MSLVNRVRFLIFLLLPLTVSFAANDGRPEELKAWQDYYVVKARSALLHGAVHLAEKDLTAKAKLHEQLVSLHNKAPGAVSKQEFRTSETAVKIATLKVEESKLLVQASQVDEELELSAAKGETIQYGKLYRQLWSIKNKAALVNLEVRKEEASLSSFIRDIEHGLFEKGATSQKNVIFADREYEQAVNQLEAARDLVLVTEEAMKAFK